MFPISIKFKTMKQKAQDKIEAKIYALEFEVRKLHGELAMGLSAGVTIKESYGIVENLNKELKIYEYILEQLNKQ